MLTQYMFLCVMLQVLGGKMTFGGRQPLVEDKVLWKRKSRTHNVNFIISVVLLSIHIINVMYTLSSIHGTHTTYNTSNVWNTYDTNNTGNKYDTSNTVIHNSIFDMTRDTGIICDTYMGYF